MTVEQVLQDGKVTQHVRFSDFQIYSEVQLTCCLLAHESNVLPYFVSQVQNGNKLQLMPQIQRRWGMRNCCQ